jgi:hypothetical protein
MTAITKPQLEDPLCEREIFASEVTGAGLIHGNIAITFANIRFEEAIGSNPPKARRIVAARLMLTNVAARQLIDNLQKLSAQIEAMQMPTAGKTPN